MANFTKAQEKAISEQSKSLLVSAAAGSGKTTTLIERIIRSVARDENPIMLDRLLVVTFTKAAASELRLRISAALSDAIAKNGGSEVLAKQFTLLSSAKISTIDSFCLDLVRTNYATLGLSPSFRIADDGESTLLANETMDMLINECYDDPNSKLCGGAEGFAALVDLIVGSADDSRLCDTLLSLYETLSSYPEGASALYDCEALLREYAKRDFFECPHGKRIEKHLSDVFEYFKKGYIRALDIIQSDAALAKAYEVAFAADLHGIIEAESALKSGYAEGREAISKIAFARLGSFRGEKTDEIEFVKELRTKYKDQIQKSISGYIASDAKTISKCLIETADVCHSLAEFLCEYERRAEAEKKRLGVCDFDDLSRYTLRLLVDENGNDTPFAISQKELYDAVYIDEYQDVNAVQDRIFSAISKTTNRFMVGDIKQSIYAFRGAEPTIFANLRSEYPNIENAGNSDNATIFMSENFRCSKEVINFTNMIFDKLMPLVSPDMNYKESDSLVFRKKCETDRAIPAEIVITEKPPKGSPDENMNTEADFIAREICRLVNNEVKDNGDKISYGDIAILMRSPRAKMDIFAGTLNAYGIPVYTETNENLLHQSEIEIIICLLEAIDNPRRDIALCGTLLSPICGFDCNFVAALRKNIHGERLYTTLKNYISSDTPDSEEKRKATFFVNQLSDFRRMARFMSAGEMIDEVYNRYAAYARLGASSPLRRANLERLRHVAYSFSGGAPRSLSEFLRYIRNIENNGKTQLAAARPGLDTPDAVRIMSVHQSKGLEFPVVFFADTVKDYNLQDAAASPLYSGSAGFGAKLRDDSGFCVYDTLLRKSIALHITRATKEEELRLLYVALTRARERLYMTAMHQTPGKLISAAKTESEFLTEYSAVKLTNHMSLALLAACGEETEYLKIRTVPYAPAKINEKTQEELSVEETVSVDMDAVKLLSERFEYHYPHTARSKIPAKLAISRLYPDILDDTILSDTIEQKKLPKAVIAPKFIENTENSAAKRGTATHLFMQFFDFDNAAKSGARAELERLTKKHFITPDDSALVNLDEVEVFLKSKLFSDMREAKTIYREQRFNLNLDASDFANDEGLKAELSGENVLVQGVIDCFFYDQNGDIILVDYKTDRVSKSNRAEAEAKLKEAHSEQLGYYARAIEEICGKAPKSTLIYSLCLGDTVEI